MKRYLVLVYYEYAQYSPVECIKASFDDLDDAKIYSDRVILKDWTQNCASVFDLELMEEVYKVWVKVV